MTLSSTRAHTRITHPYRHRAEADVTDSVAPDAGTTQADAADLHADCMPLVDARAKIENLEIALHSRQRIGTAMGILMERFRIDEEQAFDVLRAASQSSHRKLREIAEEIVYTGAMPS